MASYNRTILVGNLTRDPEMRYTPKGTAIVQGGIAVNHKWKTEGGEEKEDVLFLDFSVWGRAGETFAQYTRKGDPILLEGRLKLDQWEDKNTKEKRSKVKLTVENFQFLGGKREGGEAPRGARPPASGAEAPQPDAQEYDVPF